MNATRKRLGEMLVDAGLMQPAGVQGVLQQQRQRAGRFGQIAVDTGLVDEEDVVVTLAAQLGVSMATSDQLRVTPALLQAIPRDVADRFQVFPVGLGRDGPAEVVFVATSDPLNAENLNALQARLGKKVRPVLAGERALARAIQENYADPEQTVRAPPSPTYLAASVPTAAIRAVPSAPRAGGATVLPPAPAMPPAAQAAADGTASRFAQQDVSDLPTVSMDASEIPVDFEEPTADGTEEEQTAPHGDDVDMDVEVETPPSPAPAAAGSVFTALPVQARPDAMGLQIRALIKQGLVEDVLIWVFIDKGILTEAEAVRLRGGRPLDPRS
ncbi:MAG: hypothetical protein HY904_11195 [Deltaproteobacteria bacterium]|nr:hypothetical protein [Deltaproteobacteria bacterium]